MNKKCFIPPTTLGFMISSNEIIQTALSLGFDSCGIASAECLNDEAERVEKWLSSHFNAEMDYLEKNRKKRYDPRLLVPETKSIVCVALNYFQEKTADDTECKERLISRISKYAYGKDYHKVLKDKLFILKKKIEEKVGEMKTARVFCDSAPVLERAWAVRAGLGFIGKNTSLIIPGKGSFFFIGTLFLPLTLEPSASVFTNRCGTCTRCIDACPTKALSPFSVDARKCISFVTIERKSSLKDNEDIDLHGCVFGCDKCQDVCPYNRKFAAATTEKHFKPLENLLSLTENDVLSMDKATFEKEFSDSPLMRAGFEKFKDNVMTC